jgi:ATP adenylyltransferase
MDRLYTPWRSKYVISNRRTGDNCVFCAKLEANPADDRENLVVYRGQHTFTIMNIYPYNTGHLLILPHQHVATLAEMGPETQAEMMSLVSYFTELLTQVMNPDGFNIGINLGKAAGAGMADHIHAHLVPRWSGDSNFMAIVGNTRVLPELLEDTYDKILAGLQANPPGIK